MKKPIKSVDLEEILSEIEERGFHMWLVNFLTRAFAEARKNKRHTHDEHEFEVNWGENILNLAQSIEERNYEPGSSIAFVVFDPMVREIFAAPFRDRSTHHLLHGLGAGWWDERFVDASTSCRAGKGTLYAIKLAQEHMRGVTKDFTEKAWVIKLDIQGYFMSLPREKLCERIVSGLTEQFEPYRGRAAAEELYATCKFLWEKVIMDDPIAKARKKGRRVNWDPGVLPPRKSLYCQPEGQGIVIGNLTSQLASNIFLNTLDKFIVEELGYKYYGRYVDDFYIMVEDERYPQLKRDVRLIEEFLRYRLKLRLHPKKRYMQSVYKGMPFLGARIYPHCLYPSDRLQAKFRKAVWEYNQGQGDVVRVISYLGHMRHLDADGFVRKVFREVGWNYGAYLASKSEMRLPMEDLVEEMRGW